MYSVVVFETPTSGKIMSKEAKERYNVLFDQNCKNRQALSRNLKVVADEFMGCNYSVFFGDKFLYGGPVDNMN